MSVAHVRAEDLLSDAPPRRRPLRPGIGSRRHVAGAVLALAGLPLLTLMLRGIDSSLSGEGEVLVYLLAVVVIALVGGAAVAVPSAVAAALLINYYFVAPRHTLDVARGDQAVALAVFVVVAVVVSGAMDLATRRARAAEQAAARAETLSALAGPSLDAPESLRTVLDQARTTFDMESVTLKARAHDGAAWEDVEQTGTTSQQPLRFDVPAGSNLRLVGRGPALFAEDRRVLEAFAAAAQTAYDGRRLSTQAREARSLAVVDRQRTALLAAVGHDLRTPLASIKAAVTTLQQTDVDWSPEDRRELLATIEGSADRLDAIVANLLDASRLEAGAVTAHPEAVALDQCVSGAVLAVPGAGGAVRLDVPEDVLVCADPGLLERVLVNLVDNAIRHGGGAVDVTARAGAETAKVEIADHGPGVAPEHREELFRPFRRLDDHSAHGGVGVGLWVARGFAEAMGGALVADGSDGGGLTMRLRLPLAER